MYLPNFCINHNVMYFLHKFQMNLVSTLIYNNRENELTLFKCYICSLIYHKEIKKIYEKSFSLFYIIHHFITVLTTTIKKDSLFLDSCHVLLIVRKLLLRNNLPNLSTFLVVNAFESKIIKICIFCPCLKIK